MANPWFASTAYLLSLPKADHKTPTRDFTFFPPSESLISPSWQENRKLSNPVINTYYKPIVETAETLPVVNNKQILSYQ